MLRAPFIALLALLAGAAFACSDTVPPPGATLSGLVYLDANANGIRDSCDDADVDLFVTVELYTGDPDGPRFTATPDKDHRWQIGDVPRGEYLLALEPALRDPPMGEFFWLTTGPATPFELSVKGYEAIDGLDIGVGYPSPIFRSSDYVSAYAVIFEDRDKDGEADADECAIQPVVLNDLSYGNIIRGEGGEPEAFQVYPYFPADGFDRAGSDVFWRRTQPPTEYGCNAAPLRKVPSSPNLYEARLGVAEVTGTAQLMVNVFEDIDGDSELDPGEPLIPESVATIQPDPETCLFGPPHREVSDHGKIVFDDVPSGAWHVTASIEGGCYLNNGCSLVSATPTWGQAKQVTVSERGVAEVSLGYQMQELSELVVRVIEDANGNGVIDSGEPPAAGVTVCNVPSDTPEDRRPETCRPTSSTGNVRFRVSDRSGSVYVASTVTPIGGWTTTDLPSTWTVESGETLALTLLARRS